MNELIGLFLIIGFIYFLVNKIKKQSITIKPTLKNNRNKKENSISTTGRSDYSVQNISGFYGSTEYSSNREYCVMYADGYFNNEKWKNGEIALLRGSTLLFKKKLQRPNSCHVSNDGIVICCDWLDSEALTGEFLVFDNTGEQIFTKKTTANLGACVISSDSKIAIFETFRSDTADSNQLFLTDIEKKTIFNKFSRPHSFNSAEIDTVSHLIKLKDHHGFVFEIDYEGHQTNRVAYENQVLREGSVYDKLWIYESKANDIKNKDENYLYLLIQALDDENASYGFGKDMLYRKIGEYYEAAGDISKTIENWEKALVINLKVGIKRKFDVLKKRIPPTNRSG